MVITKILTYIRCLQWCRNHQHAARCKGFWQCLHTEWLHEKYCTDRQLSSSIYTASRAMHGARSNLDFVPLPWDDISMCDSCRHVDTCSDLWMDIILTCILSIGSCHAMQDWHCVPVNIQMKASCVFFSPVRNLHLISLPDHIGHV